MQEYKRAIEYFNMRLQESSNPTTAQKINFNIAVKALEKLIAIEEEKRRKRMIAVIRVAGKVDRYEAELISESYAKQIER